MTEIKEEIRQIDGNRLRILSTHIDNAPYLLIFNGIGASADLLRPLITSLEVSVITFDLPGVGSSPAQFWPRRMHQYARMAQQLLKDMEIEQCNVMGISWGGGLAQEFARRYPASTNRLILAATSTGQLMLPPSLAVMMRMATPLRYFSAGYFNRIAGDIYGGDFRNNRKRSERHQKTMDSPSTWGYLSQLYAMSGWTSLFWLHKIAAPTLVMAGDDDPIIPMANARLLVNRIPDAQLEVFDCGHLFVLTRLDAVISRIHRFLNA
jgi:poly(3-hydroxyalkanoate) depolymerase